MPWAFCWLHSDSKESTFKSDLPDTGLEDALGEGNDYSPAGLAQMTMDR